MNILLEALHELTVNEEINLKALVCPNCGGQLTQKTSAILKCPYCDSEFYVSDTEKEKPVNKPQPNKPIKTNWYDESTILNVLDRVELGKAPSNFALYFDNQKLSRYYDVCLKHSRTHNQALQLIKAELKKRGLLRGEKPLSKGAIKDFKIENPEFRGWRGR